MDIRSRKAALAPEVYRARTKSLLVRLSDREREMLDAIAAREQLSASEMFRLLVRREFERTELAVPKTTKGKK